MLRIKREYLPIDIDKPKNFAPSCFSRVSSGWQCSSSYNYLVLILYEKAFKAYFHQFLHTRDILICLPKKTNSQKYDKRKSQSHLPTITTAVLKKLLRRIDKWIPRAHHMPALCSHHSFETCGASSSKTKLHFCTSLEMYDTP